MQNAGAQNCGYGFCAVLLKNYFECGNGRALPHGLRNSPTQVALRSRCEGSKPFSYIAQNVTSAFLSFVITATVLTSPQGGIGEIFYEYADF